MGNLLEKRAARERRSCFPLYSSGLFPKRRSAAVQVPRIPSETANEKLSAPPTIPPAAPMKRSAPCRTICAGVSNMPPPSRHGAKSQASDTNDSRSDHLERAALAPSFRIHRLFPVHDFLRNLVRNLLELHAQ